MVLRLYGYAAITCTKTVRCVLEELNVPYELINVDLSKGEHKNQEYKAKQPFGQVPYIDDDGFVLYESRAICYYIARKFGGVGKLIPDPTDIQKIARFEQAASVEVTSFERGASGLVHETFFKRIKGIPNEINTTIVEHYQMILENKLEGYETILSGQKYIAGDEFSLIDIFHLFYGTLLKEAGFSYLESGYYPSITRWWNDISSRPSWKNV
ncbi:thioredoxin-like protein [Dichomitus squalens LYAD-421 SS1]|uniref:glutathione transferase n=1 Tax=Dichomitus squalens (strain LYAD-421) TaxID=732165 RepID=R7STT9_DICSQ|nr:thioredoxin-like protein [Dichomitus squalens LYAD-421 SS1]EJF59318.1 thioredoxin-like protein [Dichomitus squalens LYAD-421 SS1]